MIVFWTPEAEQDRSDIYTLVEADDPQAAMRMDMRFGDAAAQLVDYPQLGKKGSIPGTRELLPHKRYRMIYELDDTTAWILAIVHTSRQWPPVDEHGLSH